MSADDLSEQISEAANEWVRVTRHFSDLLRSAENEELTALRKKMDSLRREVLATCSQVKARGKWDR